MMTIYIILCAILSVLFCFNVREQYIMAHLLPWKTYIEPIQHRQEADDIVIEKKIKDIINHYYGMTVVPIRRAMIIEKFGPDLGDIIVSYLPMDDEFEITGDVAKGRTVF